MKSQPPNQPTPTRSPTVQAAHAVAERVDDAGDLVARARAGMSSQHADHGQDVGVADAAGVDLDADLAWAWFRDLDVDDLELRICRGDAGDLHRGHVADITPGCEVYRFGGSPGAEAVTPPPAKAI